MTGKPRTSKKTRSPRDSRLTRRGLLVLLVLLAVGAGVTVWSQPTSPELRKPVTPTDSTENNAPDDLVRFTRNEPGESKPIHLAADEVHSWKNNGEHILHLQGHVLIRFGIVQARCQRCIAWIDLDEFQASGLWHVTIYGEEDIRFNAGTTSSEGKRALLHLYTRGELKVHSARNKVVSQNLAREPLLLRGEALRKPKSTKKDDKPTLRRTGLPALPALPTSSAVPTGTPTPPLTTPSSLPPLPELSSTPAPLPPLPELPRTFSTSSPPPPERSSVQPRPIVVRPPAPTPTKPTKVNQVDHQVGTSPPKPLTSPLEPLPSPERLPSQIKESTSQQQFLPAPPRDPIPQGDPNRLPRVAPGAPTPLPPPSQPTNRPAPRSKSNGPPRQYSVAPRSSSGFDIKMEPLGESEQAIIVTGGVILNVTNAPGIGLLDIEADRLVIFTKGNKTQQLLNNLRNPSGESSTELEFYLSGNVEIRQETAGKDQRTLKADEVYYDVNRNVAVALRARLEMKPPLVEDSIVVRADEIRQTSATTFEAGEAEIFSSKLPSDPGLKVYVTEAFIEDQTLPQTSLFGHQIYDRETGEPLTRKRTWVKSKDVYFEAKDVPFFYLPYVAGDARDPLGPIEDFRMGWNRIFGARVGVGLNMYDLLGVQPVEGTRWMLDVDYLSRRGPALGTTYDYAGQDLFTIRNDYEGTAELFGIYDRDDDFFGVNRVQPFDPPGLRGRALWRQQVYDLPYGFTVQSQIDYWSDRNFLEQYFKDVYDTGLPHSSYLYVKQQQGSWAWSAQARGRLNPWLTDTEWLPRGDAYLLGYSFFDAITYNSHVGAGFGRLRLSNDGQGFFDAGLSPSPALVTLSPTDVESQTGRIHWFQEASVPFSLGALRAVPYAKMDIAGYSEDLTGESSGRIWGGGGLRLSLPFTKIYPDAKSELFNVNGINHKVIFHGDYFYAEANEPYTRYPQLDRINDDTADMALRDLRPLLPFLQLRPDRAAALATPLYDPQIHAIRRLIDNRFDSLEAIQALNFGISQRWQTKRGYPGSQHILDFMTLDMSATFFPQKERDNFGKSFAFLEYDWSWNIGDRTTLVSNAWVDPIENGPRTFTVGAFLNRSDRTQFFLSYRQVDPVQSKAVIGSVTYIFSPKYALTASSSYDFGTSTSLTNTVVFSRVGTDVTVSLGLSYDALQNNVGALVEIIPNLVPQNRRRGTSLLGGGQ